MPFSYKACATSLLGFLFSAIGGWAEETSPSLDWWSLKPLARPAVPQTDHANPVDRFVVAKHQENGLKMSPEADRRTLIRRLSFDLTGLPPTPDEVQQFVSDPDPDAYTKLVDRLLASPRYGERWARHWLDVVHYGDTHGYDKDKLRPNAYPYRDYVIRAFNEDKPYARFVREQLAGDALWPDTADGVVATGFIAAGPWDFIGHAEVPETKIDGKVARHLDRDDMVASTMNTFCAFTVQCAQCHDHKRDPVTMEDYYSLQAVFAALDRADRPYFEKPEHGREFKNLTKAKAEVEGDIAANEEAITDSKSPELLALEKQIAAARTSDADRQKGRSDRYGYHSNVAKKQDTVKWVQVDLGKSLPIAQIVLAASDEYGFADFGFPHRFKVEVSDDAQFQSARVIADHTDDDSPRPGADLISFNGQDAEARYVRVTATKLWNRRRYGQPETGDWIFALGEMAILTGGKIAKVERVTSLDSIQALPRWGREDLIDGVYGTHPIAPEALPTMAKQTADERQEHAADLEVKRQELAARDIDSALIEKRDSLGNTLQGIKQALAELPSPKMVYAGTIHTGSGTFKGTGHDGGKPRTITVLGRGDVTQPGKEVGPGALPFIENVPSRFDLAPGHRESKRRIQLAEWIVHKDNPLTWRTIVNRVWLYHFGRGIVDSPNDFGSMGQLPTHPELLDWLAVEFRDGGGSIKDLHRLIVNSATYKQASDSDPAFAEIDAGNRFLWRANRRKLEAEAVRDTILLVSGKLDEAMYGPGYYDFVLEKTEHSPHYQYHKHDPDDPKSHRRSIYRFLVRSQPAPFMDTLDCADPSFSVDKRNETLTPLQALSLLNNKFVVRMGEHFAKRVEAEADPVMSALRMALSRRPTEGELSALREYAEEHGLAAACRVIFNLNEFAFVD